MIVNIGRTTWACAAQHLLGGGDRVLFWTAADDTERLVISDQLLVPDADLDPGPGCVQLTDDAKHRVLQWSMTRAGWLVEAHSHLGPYADPAQLSTLDVAALGEWVPHVRWRLRQRPYAAVVAGPRTIDGVAWRGPKGTAPEAITAFHVDGTQIRTTGLSVAQF